jgi:hypothetical protein
MIFNLGYGMCRALLMGQNAILQSLTGRENRMLMSFGWYKNGTQYFLCHVAIENTGG